MSRYVCVCVCLAGLLMPKTAARLKKKGDEDKEKKEARGKQGKMRKKNKENLISVMLWAFQLEQL